MTPAERSVLERLLGASWTAWPVPDLPSLSREQIMAWAAQPGGIARVADYYAAREERIDLARKDPWRHGYRLPSWENVTRAFETYDEVLVMGGNRSSKSECAAVHVVDTLEGGGNRIVACFHSSATSSVRQQQEYIHRNLPPEHRQIKQGTVAKVKFSLANGFTDDIFILPNRSACYFFNYGQDEGVLEGYEFDLVWCDELVPKSLLKTLRFRMATRRGKMLVTFTPIQGYTPAVAEYMAGARPVRTREVDGNYLSLDRVHAKDCPPGHMPLEMECAVSSRRVFFFFSIDNIFSPYDEVCKKVEGGTEAYVKERLYGWPEKTMGTAFPRFCSVHVVKRERFEEIAKQGVTRWCVIDPGEAKNWFIKWYAMDRNGWAYVYREWPDKQRHGAWSEPSDKNVDGKPGPAQRSEFGRGINDYKRLILELEGWVWDEERRMWIGDEAEVIYERLMDSRLGAAEVPSLEGGTSIIDLMGEADHDKDGTVTLPEMDFMQSSGARIKGGIQRIADWMSYNPEAPVTVENCPKLYVVEDCEQTRYAWQEYTGQGPDGGRNEGALKDIVDCDRYFVMADPEYVAPGQKLYKPGGAYGGGFRR